MKKYVLSLFCLATAFSFSQSDLKQSYFDLNYFKGNILEHNLDVLHLIKGHPEGLILSWNKKTFGNESWEEIYNFPDYGLTMAYQNLKNPELGNVYSLYGHYNFYFFKRHLMFRIGQGVAYAENIYNKETNSRNIAYGTHLLSSTMMMLNFKKENVIGNFGVMAGLSLIHYSNANVKAPNLSTNSGVINVGITYNVEQTTHNVPCVDCLAPDFDKRLKYNIVFRTGINESDYINTGQFPFYIFSGYADKRLSQISAIQLGVDVFFSKFLKELIYYNSVAYPEIGVKGDEDYKRVGAFVGHELFINKLSIETQVGYYVYYPYDFEGQVYLRIGLKRYFGEDKRWFGAVTLKSHGAKAEAMEFGIGVRL